MVRSLLAILVLGFALTVALPAPAAATSVDCDGCPATDGASEACGQDCPLCVCGPHRAPMSEPRVLVVPVPTVGYELAPDGDSTAIAPAPRDILHVPRFA